MAKGSEKSEVVIEIRMTLKGDWPDGSVRRGHQASAEEIAGHLKHTIKEDFGADAWGGYDGPAAQRITARVASVTPRSS